MKKLSFALRLFSGILVAVVAFVFVVLEATLLVTLDFKLYENQALAFVQLILRLVIAAYALVLGVFSTVKRERSFLWEGIYLLAASVVMIFFVSNNIGVYFAIISFVFVISHLLFERAKTEN